MTHGVQDAPQPPIRAEEVVPISEDDELFNEFFEEEAGAGEVSDDDGSQKLELSPPGGDLPAAPSVQTLSCDCCKCSSEDPRTLFEGKSGSYSEGLLFVSSTVGRHSSSEFCSLFFVVAAWVRQSAHKFHHWMEPWKDFPSSIV